MSGCATTGSVQVQSFEAAWSTVGTRYYDAEMGGVDWQATHDELLPKAKKAKSNAELRPIIEDMTQRLGESHFGIIPAEAYDTFSAVALSGAGPEAAQDEASDAPGELGMDVRWVEDHVLVTWLDPEGPAAGAGIQLGWSVEQLGDRSAAELLDAVGGAVSDERHKGLYVRQAVLAYLEGAPGTQVKLTVADGDGQAQELELTRAPSTGALAGFGNLPPTVVHVRSHVTESGLGYVAFNIFLTEVVPQFTQAIVDFKEAGVSGVIIDLRGNPGGLGGMVMGMAGHFVSEPEKVLGVMKPRGEELRFVANPRPRSQRLDVPVAVLIDGQSGSTSEIFAAGFQGNGIARVFGTRSAGMALPSHIESLPNGDRLQFVTADMVGPTGARIEGAGVTPDEEVPLSREALLSGTDPVLAAATKWLESQVSSGDSGDANKDSP